MSAALLSLTIPLATAMLLLLFRTRAGTVVIVANTASLVAAMLALDAVMTGAREQLSLGNWDAPLGIRFELGPLTAVLLVFTALIHLLVTIYAQASRHSKTRDTDFWPLSCLLHASLAALWLSRDLFNWYITLELLGLTAVAMIIISGPRSHLPALRYLLLSLAASLCYLLGVAFLYGRYGVLDIRMLAEVVVDDPGTRLAMLLLTLGLMLKAALWPLHQWLPAAHAAAPTAVSALLSALVVKGPLFILWMVWSTLAEPGFARQAGVLFAFAGIAALVSGGWAALRTPWLKVLVAYSTVAQLGYALLALGLLLYWQDPEMSIALWLFVLAHGLAKVSMFLGAGEMQATLGSRRVSALKGASQTMPLAMFAFAVAGGSLIGLPPSGGFIAKWVLLQPLLVEPSHWPWALGVLLGTLASAGYVFRVVTIAFNRADPSSPGHDPDTAAQWLAMLPALIVWAMALLSEPLILWFQEVGL
ncbi:NADH-quinone oxidoreductase subunit J [Kineobactrum sediminis]|uniref:NADH-quinone oxidoreductase subunit J n=1 Tax=Kineobactrum sediminis TaxID=1905677 RepID=A0A2N5Y1L3_9GAMM|nr:proton-conducting transporter membrane subunit [Kineobactrum sediminis]PLW82274.1 NADH-quinone oxidoreductase subunit J [Kineobactrum sediminis]